MKSVIDIDFEQLIMADISKFVSGTRPPWTEPSPRPSDRRGNVQCSDLDLRPARGKHKKKDEL